MSILSTNILTITEPTIELEPFEIVDIESQSESDDRSKQKDKASKIIGDTYPGIRINGYDFDKIDIIYFELALEGFIPTIIVTLRDSKGTFMTGHYPKDGDVIELIIKSKDEDTYKPIRMDFDIISVDSNPVSSEEQGTGTTLGSSITYTLSGQAKIPGLLSEVVESYGKETSFNHLEKMATDLQLGFASNETSTADFQVRYCACETRLNYIQREVLHAYKNDDSFFTASIDPYYYLNFVNLNNQLIIDEELEDTLMSLINDPAEKEYADDTGINKIEKKLLLTNRKEVGVGSSMYISKYALINNSGQIFLKNGYKRVVQYYDNINREFLEFTLDPLTSDNLPNNYIPLKGRFDEDRFEKELKYKYLGIQEDVVDNGNVHSNYHYAKIQNFQNNEELEKLNLKVILPTANMSLYRYQRVPVAIFEENTSVIATMEAKSKKSGIEDDKSKDGDAKKEMVNPPKLNTFYTGFYVILKIKYIYRQSRGVIEQELTLARREWPSPI